MASSFACSESYGAGPTTADTTCINLLSASIASGSDTTTVPNANPVAIPAASSAYSYERYIRGHWTGSFTSISAVNFWKQSGTLGTGIVINAAGKGNQTYATAVNTASAIATNPIPTATGTISPSYNAVISVIIMEINILNK